MEKATRVFLAANFLFSPIDTHRWATERKLALRWPWRKDRAPAPHRGPWSPRCDDGGSVAPSHPVHTLDKGVETFSIHWICHIFQVNIYKSEQARHCVMKHNLITYKYHSISLYYVHMVCCVPSCGPGRTAWHGDKELRPDSNCRECAMTPPYTVHSNTAN